MNPERTCIVCRKKSTKFDFIKVIFNKNNEIFLQNGKNIDGSGAYICKNQDCINKCIKTKALNRAFKFPIPQEFYEELLKNFGN